VTDFTLPPDDEPFDFRRQAATYGRYRRDYSTALYDAIEARTGAPAGRRAVDLGCGTGFVTASLARRGWRPVGVDLSAPMLASARAAMPQAPLIRGRGEALALRDGAASLVTAGTAFHWMAPAPTVAQIARVLAPGAVVALFWRWSHRDGEPMRVLSRTFARFGIVVPEGFPGPLASPAVFDGSPLAVEPVVRFDTVLAYTVEEFHGFLSTVEWIRRVAAAAYEPFLEALRDELAGAFPHGVRDPNEECLIVARRR